MKKLTNAEYRYSNWISALIDLIQPKDLYLVGGRGVAKSTDVIAKRSLNVIYDMPRASLSFVSDTYVNLMTNIVPGVLLGWERQKFLEGFHYIVDKEPPIKWDRPYTKTFSYKHTISTRNGCKFFLTSLDRPSSNAGISTVHHFGDEAKYLKKQKLVKLKPALRGDANLFSHSPYFMGQTYCTDMPNPLAGEDAWILDMERNMDSAQIRRILQTAFVVNDILLEKYKAMEENCSPDNLAKIDKKLARWQDRLRSVRQDSTLFYLVSSFANADILTVGYFKTLFESLEFEEFKTAILTIKAVLEKGSRFYIALSDKHFYEDGIDYDHYDKFSLLDKITQSSDGLKYVRKTELLEGGFDAGNMMSLVVGQEHNKQYRILKDLYALGDEWTRGLADKFVNYFKNHKRKVLHLYYDRAANQYRHAKQDLATKLKNDIEYDQSGASTGWNVTLMSVGQSNITHDEEYKFMVELMSGRNKKLPALLIDKYNCKYLKSSLELAPADKDNKGRIKKVKKSEKLPLDRLPMESTNFSDAFKYLMCRKRFLKLANNKSYMLDMPDAGVI